MKKLSDEPKYKVVYFDGNVSVGRFLYSKTDAYAFAEKMRPSKVYENGKKIKFYD